MVTLPPTDWEVALRELAIESELVGFNDPAKIKTAIVLQRCDRESRMRQLENREVLLRTMRIPTLEGTLHAAEIDRDEWSMRAKDFEARALKAESRVLKLLGAILGGLVVLGAALVFLGAAFA